MYWFVALGSVVAFQNTSRWAAIVEVLIVIVLGIASIDGTQRLWKGEFGRIGHKIVIACVVSIAYLVVLTCMGLIDGIAPEPLLADISPILLVALAPTAGISLGSGMGAVSSTRAIAVACIIGSAFYFAYWSSTRGANLGASQVGLASWVLVVSLAGFLLGGRVDRKFQLAAILAILTLILSGSRVVALALAVMAAAWAVTVLVSRRQRIAQGGAQLLWVLGATATGLTVGFQNSDVRALLERSLSVFGLFAERSDDLSLIDRQAQLDVSIAAWKGSWLFGRGPGVEYVWVGFSGVPTRSTVIESAFAVLADYGLVGALILSMPLLMALWAGQQWARGGGEQAAPGLGLIALALAAAIASLASSVLDDKGVPLVLFLLFAHRSSQLSDESRASARLSGNQLERSR